MLGDQLQIDGDNLFAEGLSALAGLGSSKEKRQSHARSAANIAVTLRPASTSQRSLHELFGRIKDLSTTGCGLILDKPPYVGDIYRFHDADHIEWFLDGVLGRCVRCHLIDEDVFEAGFQLLTPLPQDSLSDGLL